MQDKRVETRQMAEPLLMVQHVSLTNKPMLAAPTSLGAV